MPIEKKFGTNEVKQIWSITYFTTVLVGNQKNGNRFCILTYFKIDFNLTQLKRIILIKIVA